MKIPLPGNNDNIPDSSSPYIKNPYPGKDLLTPDEALECINQLAGMLIIDKRYRKNGT